MLLVKWEVKAAVLLRCSDDTGGTDRQTKWDLESNAFLCLYLVSYHRIPSKISVNEVLQCPDAVSQVVALA